MGEEYDFVLEVEKLLNEKTIWVLNTMKRFSMMHNNCPESVAEHSYWVAIFAKLICQALFLKEHYLDADVKTFTESVVNMALFHDFPECITGDISFMVKHNNHNGSVLVNALKELEAYYTEKEIAENDSSKIYEKVWREVQMLQEEDYDNVIGSFKYLIVKLADWMSCWLHCKIEISTGNEAFWKIDDRSRANVSETIQRMKAVSGCFINEHCTFMSKLDADFFNLQNLK